MANRCGARMMLREEKGVEVWLRLFVGWGTNTISNQSDSSSESPGRVMDDRHSCTRPDSR